MFFLNNVQKTVILLLFGPLPLLCVAIHGDNTPEKTAAALMQRPFPSLYKSYVLTLFHGHLLAVDDIHAALSVVQTLS